MTPAKVPTLQPKPPLTTPTTSSVEKQQQVVITKREEERKGGEALGTMQQSLKTPILEQDTRGPSHTLSRQQGISRQEDLLQLEQDLHGEGEYEAEEDEEEGEQEEDEEEEDVQERQKTTLYGEEPMEEAPLAEMLKEMKEGPLTEMMKEMKESVLQKLPETKQYKTFGAGALSPLSFGDLAKEEQSSWRDGGLPKVTTVPEVQQVIWNQYRRPVDPQEDNFQTPMEDIQRMGERSRVESILRRVDPIHTGTGDEEIRDRMLNKQSLAKQDLLKRAISIPRRQMSAVVEEKQMPPAESQLLWTQKRSKSSPPSQRRMMEDMYHRRMREEAGRMSQLDQEAGGAVVEKKTGAIRKQPRHSTPKETPARKPVDLLPRKNLMEARGEQARAEEEIKEQGGAWERERTNRAYQRAPRDYGPSPSDALQLEMAKILERISSKLENPPAAAPPPRSGLKLQALQLPTVKKNSSGDVSPKDFYLWKFSVA